ncbi:hypothetical protein [Micromonospora sp. NPDC093277]|uniref:hypothetical protein n=1 Tax=Micromonospora sp. NPDC093277 TaxID=3364291 RepID=UPI00380BCECB
MAGHSRYDGAQPATVVVDDGAGGLREVAYLLTRVPLDPATTPVVAWHRVVPDDRLDLLAARYLGDPAAAWRICDANLALDPDALVGPDAEGRVIAIPGPGV